MNLSQPYGTATGPLGFPLLDKQAFALEAILKALPRDRAYAYRKTVLAKGPSEVLPGERSDVSWISEESPDRMNEVVLARGMNDSQYKLNPIVTLQHTYGLPPVGRSLWRKVVKDGDLKGVKAKTQYPGKPDGWEGTWPADVAFALVQADLLRGKSIGFLPTRVHVPEEKEIARNGWQKVGLVIDEWILLEYACTYLPAQQNAVVEAVSKSTVTLPDEIALAMGLDPEWFRGFRTPSAAMTIPFTPLTEIEKAVRRRLDPQTMPALIRQCIDEQLDRARGRV
jgi:hypothetical protein